MRVDTDTQKRLPIASISGGLEPGYSPTFCLGYATGIQDFLLGIIPGGTATVWSQE
jgi:hypothetical protein